MWNEVIHLLRIQNTEEEEEQFVSDLLDLNDWVRRQYGPLGLNCEEVTQAYNLLVMEELRKADGRVLEAWPKLDPKHVGEVLAAYRRRIDSDVNVSQVLSSGLYLPAPAEPSEEQIDAMMEQALTYAINQVRAGETYFDTGNGLYKWLFAKGRIRPSETEWETSVIEAQHQIRQDILGVKRLPGSHGNQKQLRELIFQGKEGLLAEQPDYKIRVREQAWRICLMNFLRDQAGTIAYVPRIIKLTPKLPDPPKAFSHDDYVQSIIKQLPTMDKKALSHLHRSARRRNVLDVYELTTLEYDRRANLAKSANTSTASAVRTQ